MNCVLDNPVHANGGCIFADPESFLIIQQPGGGGTGIGHGPGALPSPKPSIGDEPLYLAQALQEDEELILILKTFVETIKWH